MKINNKLKLKQKINNELPHFMAVGGGGDPFWSGGSTGGSILGVGGPLGGSILGVGDPLARDD